MIIGNIDIALVSLYVFWLFFAGLLIYLQRESRREGYPLVSEVDGKPLEHEYWLPDPKEFRLADGTVVTVPDPEKDRHQDSLSMEPAMPGTGVPFRPVGDPMLAGVGPGAYTPRARRPDLTFEGAPRIVPMRSAPDFSIEANDPDPRGMPVIAADWEEAGKVVDVWVDRADMLARYFEVELPASAGAYATPPAEGEDAAPLRAHRVLLPVNFTQVDGRLGKISVIAILSSQFANVPVTASPDLVTMDEEERICAYYGGGYLYATPQRQETLL